MRERLGGFVGILLVVSVLGAAPLVAQSPASVAIEPSTLTLAVGETAQLRAVVRDADGNVLPDAQVLFFSGNRVRLGVTPAGLVEAFRPGEHKVTALSPENPFEGAPDSYTSFSDGGIRGSITVTVPVPPLTSLQIDGVSSTVYAGTTVPVHVRGVDASGETRYDIAPTLRVSDAATAETDGFGNLTGLAVGSATLTATIDDVEATLDFTVEPNPVRTIELTASRAEARTGDVIHFVATARDAGARHMENVPVV